MRAANLWDLVVGDFNKDGKVDVIAYGPPRSSTTPSGKAHYFQTTAQGLSSPVQISNDGFTRLFAFDVDRDGNLDLVGYVRKRGSVSEGTPAENYLHFIKGDGSGHFAPPVKQSLPYRIDTTYDVATAADFNNDGIIDLVLMKQIQDQVSVWVWLGNGSGGFVAASPRPIVIPGVKDLEHLNDRNAFAMMFAVADVDQDGFNDLVMGTRADGRIRLLVNDGTGRLTVSREQGPNLGGRMGPGLSDASQRSLKLIDVDRNGHLDAIRLGANTLEVFLASGKGLEKDPSSKAKAFKLASSITLDCAEWTHVGDADVNGDSVPDLIVGCDSYPYKGRITVLLGDGTGRFKIAPGSPFGMGAPGDTTQNIISAVLPVDVNRDGKIDLIAAHKPDFIFFTRGQYSVYFGDGTGKFYFNANTSISASYALQFTAADFNHDGKPDLLDLGSGTFYLGEGTGRFKLGSTLSEEDLYQGSVNFDFNNDGLIDFIAYSGGMIHKYIANPSGGYDMVDNIPRVAYAVIFWQNGDFNGDGVEDLVGSTHSPDNRIVILLGDGLGGFSSPVGISVAPKPRDFQKDRFSGGFNAAAEPVLRSRVIEAGSFRQE